MCVCGEEITENFVDFSRCTVVESVTQNYSVSELCAAVAVTEH